MQEETKRRGRKPQDKVLRGYTIDKDIAAFLDSLPDGDRSKFVNDWLRQHPRIVEFLQAK